jgi:hypothetical protein
MMPNNQQTNVAPAELTLNEFAEKARQRYGIPNEVLNGLKFRPAHENAGRYGLDPNDQFHAVATNYRRLAELRDENGGDWNKALAAYSGGAPRPQLSPPRATRPVPTVYDASKMIGAVSALSPPAYSDDDLEYLRRQTETAEAAYRGDTRARSFGQDPLGYSVGRTVDWLLGKENRDVVRQRAVDLRKKYNAARAAAALTRPLLPPPRR